MSVQHIDSVEVQRGIHTGIRPFHPRHPIWLGASSEVIGLNPGPVRLDLVSQPTIATNREATGWVRNNRVPAPRIASVAYVVHSKGTRACIVSVETFLPDVSDKDSHR